MSDLVYINNSQDGSSIIVVEQENTWEIYKVCTDSSRMFLDQIPKSLFQKYEAIAIANDYLFQQGEQDEDEQ
jgi:hypothetical protein